MFHRIAWHLAIQLALALSTSSVLPQQEPKPLSQKDPRLVFSFPIQSGSAPLRFVVNLDDTGSVTGVFVYRNGEHKPIQRLASCSQPFEQITDRWEDHELSKLVAHTDFNFDGFEDLELLTAFIPHLDKRIYCVYLWDQSAGRFVLSKQLSDIASNLEAHPENKTLISHEAWQGGAWQQSTYRWNGNKLEVIEESSLLGNPNPEKSDHCGFTYWCSGLINGKLTVTLSKPICSIEEMEHLPACPSPVLPTQNLPTSPKLP